MCVGIGCSRWSLALINIVDSYNDQVMTALSASAVKVRFAVVIGSALLAQRCITRCAVRELTDHYLTMRSWSLDDVLVWARPE
jgi:hypothetical protein